MFRGLNQQELIVHENVKYRKKFCFIISITFVFEHFCVMSNPWTISENGLFHVHLGIENRSLGIDFTWKC